MHLIRHFCILFLVIGSGWCASSESHKSDNIASASVQSAATSVVSQPQQQQVSSQVSQSAGPEARNIVAGNGVPSSSSSSFPYSVYANAMNPVMQQTPSSSGSSWLSILRPSQGGRRASLSSRLRNIYNAIFRREQSSFGPVAQGSSISYSLRQPPSGFGGFGLPGFGSGASSGFGSLSSLSGLTSGLTSGFGSGLGLGQQNMFASASGYNPVVIPASLSSGGRWGSSKVLASSANEQSYDPISYLTQPATTQLASASNPSSSSAYGWSSSSGSQASYPSYSGNSYSGSSASAAQSIPSQSSYQASGSGYSPSSYSQSSNSYPSGNQYQRSSSASAFKPIVSSPSSSYSNGLVGSASAPAASYSSVSKPVSSQPSSSSIATGSIVSGGSNTLSSSYATQ